MGLGQALLYVCVYKNKDEDRPTDPKDVGRGRSTIQTAGRTRAEREGNLSPSPQAPQARGFQNWPHGGFWGRVAARLGRNGGQEAQHHKMAPSKVGAGTSSRGPQSLREEPDSGELRGQG